MWALLTDDGANISMVEGDYGVALPFTVSGIDIESVDSVKVTVKAEKNGATKLQKDITNITDNTIKLAFTQAESALLPVGKYVYNLDWYRNGMFLCNIINSAILKVVDKA